MIPYWKSLGTLEFYTFVKEGKTKKKKKYLFHCLDLNHPIKTVVAHNMIDVGSEEMVL